MKKKVITVSTIVSIALVSFYLGTTVSSMFAAPQPDLIDNIEPCGAVIKDGKVYGVGFIKSSGTIHDGKFVYRVAVPLD